MYQMPPTACRNCAPQRQKKKTMNGYAEGRRHVQFFFLPLRSLNLGKIIFEGRFFLTIFPLLGRFAAEDVSLLVSSTSMAAFNSQSKYSNYLGVFQGSHILESPAASGASATFPTP